MGNFAQGSRVSRRKRRGPCACIFSTLLLAACATPAPKPLPAAAFEPSSPAPTATPLPSPTPTPATPAEPRYTVVVQDVPVREVLFALARDAAINLDVRGDLTAKVTLNAVEQTVPEILARIGLQVPLRVQREAGAYVVTPDEPFVTLYDVGYVNLARDTDTTVYIATEVATTGEGGVAASGQGPAQGGNGSGTRVSAKAAHHFWDTLVANVGAVLGGGDDEGPASVVANPEAGVLAVRATARQHALVKALIDQVLTNARRQVLVEATVVEIGLDDAHQAGVDWRVVLAESGHGVQAAQALLAAAGGTLPGVVPALTLGYRNTEDNGRVLDATLQLLQRFGDTRVLSSPRLMVLNNQTALLKVVEELVYFTVGVTNTDTTANARGRTFVQSEVHSVPVGLVMAVTPQISANDEITLTVRPTISQKVGEALDPGPRLAAALNGNAAEIQNLVPVIRTRELESVLKLVNGQVGVLGGLMQEELRHARQEVPGFAALPGIGRLFTATTQEHRKTELVVFLRPVVVESPDAAATLAALRDGSTETGTP